MGEISLETLAQGAHCGLKGDAYKKAITSRKDFDEFWKQYTSNAFPPDAQPKVDFRKEMVLVAYDGQKSSTGYSISLSVAIENGNTLDVYVRRESPGSNAGSGMVMTQPYHIVKAPKHKDVRFVADVQFHHCGPEKK
jgi:PrcB C-terminal